MQEVIGQGSFGIVSKAINIHDGTTVAIKTIKKVQPTLNIDAIKKEIRIMKLVKHKHIIKLIDVYENKAMIYIVMEYMSGGDLYTKYCTKKECFSEAKVKRIFTQIAGATKYMQDLGIIHRDLKLENILFENENADSNVKIADFGLSALQGPYQEVTDVLGTLHYTAPEIIARKPYDYSVDIWSLGVILYVLVTGSYPFDSISSRLEQKYSGD